MSHTLTVSLYFRLLWYHSILRGSIDQKHAKTNEIWSQNSEIHSAFACSHWPPWLPDLFKPYGACVKRGSGKHMFGLSLFRPSRQSNISTSGEERCKYPLPRENKISQIPYPRDNKDNQIPTLWRFDNLFGSHLRSQSKLYHVSLWYYTLVIDLIGQLRRDVIGRLSVKPWCY